MSSSNIYTYSGASSRSAPIASTSELAVPDFRLISGPTIRYCDMRFTPNAATTALIRFIQNTPAWEAAGNSRALGGVGIEKYGSRRGAANLVRYTEYYHQPRDKYCLLNGKELRSVGEIIDGLIQHFNTEYRPKLQEEMVAVYLLLTAKIDDAVLYGYLASANKFPQKLRGRSSEDDSVMDYLDNFIDLVVSGITTTPHHFEYLTWQNLDTSFYERAKASETHGRFFAFAIGDHSKHPISRAQRFWELENKILTKYHGRW